MFQIILSLLLLACTVSASTRNGYIKLTDAKSKVLDASGSSGGTSNGQPVHLWEYLQSHYNQVWEYNSDKNQIRNVASGKCLDSPDRRDRGEVHMWSCRDGNRNQDWYFDSMDRLHLKDTDYCLDNSGHTGQNHFNGNNLQIYRCIDTRNSFYAGNQRWNFVLDGLAVNIDGGGESRDDL